MYEDMEYGTDYGMSDTISAACEHSVRFSRPARRAFVGAFFGQGTRGSARQNPVCRAEEICGRAGLARACAAGHGAKNVDLSRGVALGREGVPADQRPERNASHGALL